MSITPVPISIRLVLAPMAASRGKGEDNWRAKWCTRKNAPSAPSSSATTASSMDCSSASEAERVCDCGDGVQWPNDRNPIRFMPKCNNTDGSGFLATQIEAPSSPPGLGDLGGGSEPQTN